MKSKAGVALCKQHRQKDQNKAAYKYISSVCIKCMEYLIIRV